MRYVLSRVIFIFTLFLSLALPAQAQPQNYNLDPMHTYVVWNISHFGFSIQYGKFTQVSGTLVMDPSNPQNSKLNVTIPMNMLETGLAKLNEHLKGSDFFDISKFPTATFASDKIMVTGKNTGKVTGMLTLHGIMKPVTLDVTLLKSGVSPISNKQTMGFTATTTIKRSDFGINDYLPGLGDDVGIIIGSEANLAG